MYYVGVARESAEGAMRKCRGSHALCLTFNSQLKRAVMETNRPFAHFRFYSSISFYTFCVRVMSLMTINGTQEQR